MPRKSLDDSPGHVYNPKSGYKLDCVIVTDVRGRQQFLTAAEGETEVSGESTITVCVVKTGTVLSTTPNMSAGGSELLAGLGAIGAVAVYYGVIWLLRDRLRKEYVFNIK